MLGYLLGRQFGRQSTPRPWANRRRLVPGLCAAYLLLLFVASLPTPADARRTLYINNIDSVTEPDSGSKEVWIKLEVSEAGAPVTCTIHVGTDDPLLHHTPDRATKNEDWSSPRDSHTITIPENSKTKDVKLLSVLADDKREPNEAIALKLTTSSDVEILTTVKRVTIIDNPPKPKVSIADASATEGSEITFTVSVSPTYAQAMTLTYKTTDGTATTADSDYTGTSSGSVTISANAASATFSVATGDDTEDEANETFTVTLSGVPADVKLTRATATGTINNDDRPVVSIAGGSAITEGGTATFSLSATPKPPASITVNVNVGQTGDFAASGQTGSRQVTIGTGGTGSLTVSTLNDDIDEANGFIRAAVKTGNGYLPSRTHFWASVNVNDNDEPPVVSITGGSAITEGGTATFSLSATPKPAASITVNVNVEQTGDFAANGQTGARQVTIGTGGTGSLTVSTLNDEIDEANGSIKATVSTGNGYSPSSTNGAATMNVNDNDEPVVSISGGSAITEGGIATFSLSATPKPAASITVNVNVEQTGDFASNGQTGARQVTIGTGGTGSLTVSTQDDDIDEAGGSITATVKTGSGYSPSGTNGAATMNVNDNDDPPPPVVSIAGGSAITEGGTVTFSLSAPPIPPASITVNVNVDQTGDFAANGQTGTKQVTIGTGGTGSLTVSTVNDDIDEAGGSITATVNAGDGYSPSGTNGAATVNVNDNDDPPPQTPVVSIAGGSTITEGGTATFSLSATPTPPASITVNVNVDQTGDFAANGQTGTKQVTIGTGGTGSLTVSTVNDDIDEANGSITATVNTGNGYSPSGTNGSASVQVNDNDEPPPQTSVVSIAGVSAITEGGVAVFTLSATPRPATSITVSVNVGQTGNFAGSGQTGTRQVTIGTGGTGSLTVSTLNDDIDEANGSITATVSTGDGYSPSGTNGSASVQVNDNDEPPPPPPPPPLTDNNPSPPTSEPIVLPPEPIVLPSEPIVIGTSPFATSIVVTYQHPTEDKTVVSSYDLRCREGSSGDFMYEPENVIGTRAIIYSLKPDTEYEIQVRASNSAGDSDWSELVLAKTRTLIPEDRFSLSLDLDDGAGDQFMSYLSILPEKMVTVQIFGSSLRAIPLNDLYVRLNYDATQVVYQDFKMTGSILTGASILSGKNVLNIGMTLPDRQTRADSGLMGTVRFSTTDAFSETEIRLVRVRLLEKGTDETIPMYRGVALNLKAFSGPLIVGDFDKNGAVSIPDFLLFVDVFGLTEDEERYDSKYDLDKNGGIGISDFLIFSEEFGKEGIGMRHTLTFTSERPVMRMVEENTSSGNPIGPPVSATMADGAALTYSLWGVDAEYFTIDANTGQLLTKAHYNFEHRNWYSPIVRVSDEEGSSTSVVVDIAIIDVGE